MKILRTRIEFETVDPIQILDITEPVKAWAKTTGVREGLLTVASLHTTARVNVNEREPELQKDMVTWLKRFAPCDGNWLHNLVAVDGRDNAHAHIIGLFVNSSESIPVSGGELVLGSWQAIFFIELDGPRDKRGLELQIMGEG